MSTGQLVLVTFATPNLVLVLLIVLEAVRQRRQEHWTARDDSQMRKEVTR